uniref:Uncharacterized protein n=1 Tax=Oryza rufipogon TaxID=4529 RepID=A0A0E0MT13_ORYRU
MSQCKSMVKTMECKSQEHKRRITFGSWTLVEHRGSAETGNVGEARRPEPGGETRERDKKGGERVAEPSGMPETRRIITIVP